MNENVGSFRGTGISASPSVLMPLTLRLLQMLHNNTATSSGLIFLILPVLHLTYLLLIFAGGLGGAVSQRQQL